MQRAVRPYRTAGMALVASSLIAVAPIGPATVVHAPTLPDISHIDVALTAGGGLTDVFDQILSDPSLLTNVATNLFHDFANIPYYLFEAPFSVQGLIPNFLGPGGGYPDTSIPAGANMSDYPDYLDQVTSHGNFADGALGGPGDGVYYGALNNLSAALDYTDSWWKASGTNIWGWDTGNPWNLTALLSVFTPLNSHLNAAGFMENTLANQVNIWATAELPEDGTGYNNFLFSDMLKEFSGYLQVPMSALESGYTLPDQTNPVGVGADALGYFGKPYQEIWSGQTVTYDPNAANTDFWNALLQDPSNNPIMPFPSLQDISTSIENLIRAQFLEFLPINPLDLSDPGADSFLFTGIPELFGLPVILSGFVWPDFSLDLGKFLDIQNPDFLNPSIFSNLLGDLSGGGGAGAVDPGDLSDVGSTPAGGAGDLATELGNLLGL